MGNFAVTKANSRSSKQACDFAEQVGRETAREFFKQSLTPPGFLFRFLRGTRANSGKLWLGAGALHGANELFEHNVLNPRIQQAAQRAVFDPNGSPESSKAPGWLPYALVGIPALTGAYALYQHLNKKKQNEQTRLELEQDED